MSNIKFKTKKSWLLYVLACEDNVFYIGLTTCLPHRLFEHCFRAKRASHATLNHPPIDLIQVIDLGNMPYWKAELYEDAKTIICMEKYGIDYCFGGRYCKLEQKEPYRNMRSGMYPCSEEWLKTMHRYAQKLVYLPKRKKYSNFRGNEWKIFEWDSGGD